MTYQRDTIRRIREAVAADAWSSRSVALISIRALGIDYGGNFLAKHRVGNPGGFTVLFVRMGAGLYQLK